MTKQIATSLQAEFMRQVDKVEVMKRDLQREQARLERISILLRQQDISRAFHDRMSQQEHAA